MSLGPPQSDPWKNHGSRLHSEIIIPMQGRQKLALVPGLVSVFTFWGCRMAGRCDERHSAIEHEGAGRADELHRTAPGNVFPGGR